MNTNLYLQTVLDEHLIKEGDPEIAELKKNEENVTMLLNKSFGSAPVLRIGGSYAKGTMIRDRYDLDILCYFQAGDNTAGGTLKEIYENVEKVLQVDYMVNPKRSALQILDKEEMSLHVDVVPGRFIDDTQEDAFLHQNVPGKDRLKTNPNEHIKAIYESGEQSAIALMKLWSLRWNVSVKTFVLELIVVDLLRDTASSGLDVKIEHVLSTLAEKIGSVSVEDPANPGNDLSDLWSQTVKADVQNAANQSIALINAKQWEQVFGPTNTEVTEDDVVEAVRTSTHRPQPYAL